MLVTVGKTIFHQASAFFHCIPRYTNLHKNLSITRCLIPAPGLDCFSLIRLIFPHSPIVTRARIVTRFSMEAIVNLLQDIVWEARLCYIAICYSRRVLWEKGKLLASSRWNVFSLNDEFSAGFSSGKREAVYCNVRSFLIDPVLSRVASHAGKKSPRGWTF